MSGRGRGRGRGKPAAGSSGEMLMNAVSALQVQGRATDGLRDDRPPPLYPMLALPKFEFGENDGELCRIARERRNEAKSSVFYVTR